MTGIFRVVRAGGTSLLVVGAAVMVFALATMLIGAGGAQAAQPRVGLGTAQSFAVLAGSTVTNTGPSVIKGDLGVSPGTAVTGFPPGTVNGTIHSADAVAAQAQADTTTAYNDAAGRSPTSAITADLGGRTLVAGVYRGTTLGLTGTLTLDAQGDQSAVFVFQAGSTLITASNSGVALINGAQACNVFWQVGSSATLGTGTVFVGSILALTSVTADTGASVAGRLLARNGAVTLDSNTVTASACATPTPTSSASASSTASPSPTSTVTPTSTATPTPSLTPTRTPTPVTATPTGTATATATSSAAGPSASIAGAAGAGTSGSGGNGTGTGGAGGGTFGAATGNGGSSTGGGTGSLPFTGTPAGPLLGAGLLAVALGGGFLLTGRRPADSAGQHRH